MHKIKIFDGAMGTMLQARGLKPGACPELMNLERPEAVAEVHAAYIAAGADIIETNTFGAGTLKLAHYGLANRCAEINRAAVKIAKKAANGRAEVAGSIGPTGRFIAPLGDLDFEEAYENFRTQAEALAEAGADWLIIETCIDLQEMRAAVLAAKDACNLPLICQFSYGEDGRTVTGTDPETAATVLEALGAGVIGVNCSLGPAELLPIVEKLASSTELPISVQPNAGMPYLEGDTTKYPMGATEFGEWGAKLAMAGATFVGGCCGTTPEHIAAAARAVATVVPPKREPQRRVLKLTSRTRTVAIDAELPPRLIGERINPTGRKKLAAEIREGSLLSVKKDALNQVKAGAHLLDVNMGVGGIDQAAMERAVTELAQLTDAPLVIDTGDAVALERALRIYPGRPLINSVSAEENRLRDFLPLAKKYGAAILCLPITDDGVPKSVAERVDAVSKIITEAKSAGLRDGDFLLDALVMTVSADPRAAQDVFDTLREYKSKFAYPTTMGLSNISFGLPNRPLINRTFFALCLANGLNAPIMNPYDGEMINALSATAVLLGQDAGGIKYSQKYAAAQAGAKPPTPDKVNSVPGDPLTAIKQAVIDGAKDEIAALVNRALESGIDGGVITDKGLTAAMTVIGADFGAGRMFLPQVMLSAETMKVGFEQLKKVLGSAQGKSLGTVIMATVKGDVHDLGKNIAGALLESGGFRIIDLGKDVPKEKIVAAALEQNADIVGLCALMTTTMTEIEPVIIALQQAGAAAKVMVGGAVLTQEYADSVGADAYAADGVKAVELAKKLVKKR